MAIVLMNKIAEEMVNLISQKVSYVKCYFDDGTNSGNINTNNSVEKDWNNKCYYANIGFLLSLLTQKTIIKIEFYDADNNLLFIDNGNLSDVINQGDTLVVKKLKISYQE
ncbi:MAG: hypothetical protein QXW71_01175 [Thermoplasmata archaeon]